MQKWILAKQIRTCNDENKISNTYLHTMFPNTFDLLYFQLEDWKYLIGNSFTSFTNSFWNYLSMFEIFSSLHISCKTRFFSSLRSCLLQEISLLLSIKNGWNNYHWPRLPFMEVQRHLHKSSTLPSCTSMCNPLTLTIFL